MFSIFKKKEKPVVAQPEVIQVTAEQIEAVEREVAKLLPNNDQDSLFQIGKLYAEIDIDKSIEFYEACLKMDKGHTGAQSNLLKQYNTKRKELATSGHIDEAMKYLDKIDDVMKQSKDSIRGL